jgi:hypothetical protein
MSLPSRTDRARSATFFVAALVNALMSPLCRYGAPQHAVVAVSEHSTPLRS